MAKKSIITDFSALKGKVSFSEKTPAVHVKPEVKAESVTQSVGRVLEAGQKVILMDSNLRGTIISLGRTVCIELEDGLRIQAAYGEFAITDDHERSKLKANKVKAKKTNPHDQKQKISGTGMLTIECGRARSRRGHSL